MTEQQRAQRANIANLAITAMAILVALFGWAASEQRESALKAKTAASTYREAFALSNNAMVIVSVGDGERATVTEWSRGAEVLFGYSRSEMLGGNIDKIIPDDMREAHDVAFGNSIRRIKSDGRPFTHGDVQLIKCEAVMKSGKRIAVMITTRYVSDDAKGNKGAFIATVDPLSKVHEITVPTPEG